MHELSNPDTVMENIKLDKKRVRKILTKLVKDKAREMMPRSPYYKLHQKISVVVVPQNKVFSKVSSDDDHIRIYYSASIEMNWVKILRSKNKSASQAYFRQRKFKLQFRDELNRIFKYLGVREIITREWRETNPSLISSPSVLIFHRNFLYEQENLSSEISEIKKAIRELSWKRPNGQEIIMKEILHGIKVIADRTQFRVKIAFKKDGSFQPSIQRVLIELGNKLPHLGTFVYQ